MRIPDDRPHDECGVVGIYSERTEGEEVHGVAVLVRGEQQEKNIFLQINQLGVITYHQKEQVEFLHLKYL